MNLKDFEHLRGNPMITFKKESVDDEELTIVSYMIANSELWNLPLAKECRGITFNAQGDVVSFPFEKFFNVNENPSTQLHTLPWDSSYEVYDKLDGSMMTPVIINDKIFMKTKKSFHSFITRNANTFIANSPKYQLFIKVFLEAHLTPIFEFYHPESRVVINYGEHPKLTLLAIRDNIQGSYIEFSEWKRYAEDFSIDYVKPIEGMSKERLLLTKEETGKEGYVVVFKDTGQRVKFKSDWYLLNHRIMTELRERDVAEAVLNETIDDLKSTVVSSGEVDLAKLEKIENDVVLRLNDIYDEIQQIEEDCFNMTPKEVAIRYKEHFYFSLIMTMVRNPDRLENAIKDFFKKHFLHHYSLSSIYNPNF